MPRIILETEIKAGIEEVFDLSRNIDFHQSSLAHTDEKAIGGKTSGLIGLGESVTWRAKHLGAYRTLTSKITEFNSPIFFADEMVKGIFHSFRHEHHFKEEKGVTLMIDIFEYKSPYGILGQIADFVFLKGYMKKLLSERNNEIRRYFENKYGS